MLHDDARPPVDDRELAALIGRAAEVSRRVTDAMRRGGAQRSFLPEGGGSDADPDRASRKTRTLQAAVHLAEDLHRFETRGDGEVAWVDGTRRNVRLRLSPIDVGPVLATMLWGEVTSVLTSATIPPRIVERVGLQAFPTEELNVGSPFDYRSHALLYVARHLPDRRAAGAEEALHEELSQLLEAAGGRTLALFTSKRATEAAAAALAPELPYTLLLQGDLPKNLLLEKFAAEETSCLFATMGFWQGVDIPGRALSLVTIDKLPFPRPDDPLLQARRDRAGGGAFSLVDLPRAATLLAQGAGRLIRNAEDRGVVAVLDPRLATASYRGVLLATLPPMRRSVDIAEVESFLRRALEEERRPELASRARPCAGPRAQYPRRLSISSRFCQCRSTLTWRSRYVPSGSSSRTAMPTALRTSPPLPMTMAFCESRSTMISTRMCGHSHSVTRQVMACGSSSRVLASNCSRTSSATHSASGVSVMTSGGKKGGPSGSRR